MQPIGTGRSPGHAAGVWAPARAETPAGPSWRTTCRRTVRHRVRGHGLEPRTAGRSSRTSRPPARRSRPGRSTPAGARSSRTALRTARRPPRAVAGARGAGVGARESRPPASGGCTRRPSSSRRSRSAAVRAGWAQTCSSSHRPRTPGTQESRVTRPSKAGPRAGPPRGPSPTSEGTSPGCNDGAPDAARRPHPRGAPDPTASPERSRHRSANSTPRRPSPSAPTASAPSCGRCRTDAAHTGRDCSSASFTHRGEKGERGAGRRDP
jgi:hypothetical protein